MLSKTIKDLIVNIKNYSALGGFYVNKQYCSSTVCDPCCEENGAKNRPIRQEPGNVRLGFIPNEWFEFFFKKTGVTGLGTVCFTVGTLLVSKEFYIMDHEYYNGLSVFLLCGLSTKYVGPTLAKYIDTEVNEYEKKLNNTRESQKKFIEECIKDEETSQVNAEGQLMLIEAKRENVALQREAAYRERCMHAYKETKKRLEYCVMREAMEKAVAKRCMADWVKEEVRQTISKEIEDASVDKCLQDLQNLNKTYETLKSPYPEESIDELDKPKDPKE